jgi:hypothetical protein
MSNNQNTNTKQKVCIVTFKSEANAGTTFQAYALQTIINRFKGYEAEVLHYVPNKRFSNISFSYGYGPLSWILRKILSIRSYRFNSFQRKNIFFYPQKPLGRDRIASVVERYDWFVVGSDQVWNLELTKHDMTYFLDFAKGKKKGAYAPSVGMAVYSKEDQNTIKELLKDFSFIGVREKNAIDIVQPLTCCPVHWSLDPTFLLSKDEWAALAKPPQKKGYIFELCITSNPEIRIAAERISEKTGLPIIEYGGLRKRVPSAKRMPHPSADTWLGYLMNADYVITDSFHGVAFSINLNKEFYVILTGAVTRMHSILGLFSLEDRLIIEGNELDFDKKIDWISVNQKMNECRTECKNWLELRLKE